MNGTSARGSPAGGIVLNALVDLVSNADPVVRDDRSRQLLYESYTAAVSDGDRETFESTLGDADVGERDSIVELSEDERELAEDVLEAVLAELAGTTLRVDHDVRLPISDRDAHLYSFLCTNDPNSLDRLSCSPEVRQHVREGGDLLEAAGAERAAGVFEAAIDESSADSGDESSDDTIDESDLVSLRVLAGWARFHADDPEASVDHLREAAAIDPDSIAVRAVALAVGRDYADGIREGRFGPRLFLRKTIDVPEGASVTVTHGSRRTDGWIEPGGNDECSLLEAVGAETRLRIRLEGRLPAFPTVHGYHVSLGIVDLAEPVAETVDQVLLSGPVTEEADETVSFVGDPDD